MKNITKKYIPSIFWRIYIKASRYYANFLLENLKKNKKIEFDKSVKINGLPLLDISDGALVKIGSNVTLNSSNRGYHLNMHSPVKLMADRVGAEITIGENTRIHGSCIHAKQSIKIGSGCLIAANCQIMDSSGHDLAMDNPSRRINSEGNTKPVIIEDDVWLATGVVILPGTHIGRGSVISANSVVSGHIPAMTLAGGNPCKIIKSYLKD
ncbi:acyltransferase [Comamonas aquatica]|uniref:Acyltransferase n=1 Tax=Comamonas aquatica TaxID=225991 RepID=A0AA42HTX5_9BURK|nr:acyltransferase [Comamonas aquatica]MDH0364241.1 acyltransferase [Comamonas aquatica]